MWEEIFIGIPALWIGILLKITFEEFLRARRDSEWERL